jgi:hypothetical protein
MESQAAKVLPWTGKSPQSREPVRAEPVVAQPPSFAPIDGIVIVIPDEHLEALAALFCMSPVRRAMTFEAYLAVRGFSREGR